MVTDHSPRLTVANGLSAERLRAQLDQIAELNVALGAGFRMLTGIEVDINEDGSLDQDADLLAELDVVVALGALEAPDAGPGDDRADADRRRQPARRRARPLHRPAWSRATGKRPESQFDADAVFAACAEHGMAVEINSRPERLDPPKRLLRQAVEAGCVFTIDTDAHAPGQLDWLRNGCERAVECEVPADRVLNTWPLEKLLAATRSGG